MTRGTSWSGCGPERTRKGCRPISSTSPDTRSTGRRMTVARSSGHAVTAAADLLREARADDRAGKMIEAIQGYDAVIQLALQSGELSVMAEAYRRVAVLHHRRNQPTLARSFCQASHQLATQLGDRLLVAHALNVRAGMAFEVGEM